MKKNRRSISEKIILVITIIFVLLFCGTLLIDLVFDWVNRPFKNYFIWPNVFCFLIGVFGFVGYYLFKNKKGDLSRKRFWQILIIVAVAVFIMQLLLQNFLFFKTGWDVGLLNSLADDFVKSGNYDATYLTWYPNNVFLFLLYVIVKTIIPFGGSIGLVLLNVVMVNLAGLFTCLTIKNFTGSYKKGLISYLIMTPLTLLSPWIIIPYSDTFAVLFPILIIYLYSCEKKIFFHYFAIPFLALIGCFIKPTVIIVLIAIVIVEIVNNFNIRKKLKELDYRKFLKCCGCCLIGILLAFGLRWAGEKIVQFEPIEGVTVFNFTHFLSMGQNDKSCGTFSQKDYEDSVNNGMSGNLSKFKERILSRSFLGNAKFFTKKNLINYNDGTFAWGMEGSFYKFVPESESKITDFLRSFMYSTGKKYKYYAQFLQCIWIIVLMFCPFIALNKKSKKELVVMMTIIGITLFLLLFEARARYLYCFSPVFVVCFIVGVGKLKIFIRNKKWNICRKNRK